MKWAVLLGFLSFGPAPVAAALEMRESPKIADAFRKAGVTGTFVLLDAENGVFYLHNGERAKKRFIPASTFKIPNSLLGLDYGVVSGVDEVLPYGGKPQALKEWEKDMGLREAIRVSNVPVYQELARRIGLERMRAGLKKLKYGNMETGEAVDRFWLAGPLEISALEQVDFLSRLAEGRLPVSERAVRDVKEITLLEKAGEAELHGKTGWGLASAPGIGWFVGWVERGGKYFPFALNMDMAGQEDLPKRVALARECLKILGKFASEQ